MKPTLLALLLCDAIVPGPEGKVNLYGIFNKIHSKAFPARHPQFGIFWKCFVTETGKIGINIDRPNGISLLSLDPVVVNKVPGVSQGIYTVAGIEFPMPGEYKVRLILNGIEEIAFTTLTLEER
ncbi:MAG: hypothetical protein AMJ45_05415 [Syntrophobacter sp. DG_60]|nr:MAG: hypothetical protein AMJ45_05415 [Syntrophobacter sp. DG_60]